MNFLKETIEFLKECGKTPTDVKWVGTTRIRTDWDNFTKVADTEYYSGYGGQEIAENLLIVGDNWWLERHEYDGSEWWEYKQLPEMPQVITKIKTVKSWGSLEDANKIKIKK